MKPSKLATTDRVVVEEVKSWTGLRTTNVRKFIVRKNRKGEVVDISLELKKGELVRVDDLPLHLFLER